MAAQKRSPYMMRDCKILKSVLLSIDLEHLKKIKDHILTGNCCHHSSHLKDFSFKGFTALGTTPLILACQHGELDCVKQLVKTWKVDVCDSAPFYSNPSLHSLPTIKEATPLFVAALYGHDKIVRYLLEKGAIASVKTSNNNRSSEYNGLTPLYAAVCDRQYNSRRPLPQQRKERCNIVRSLLQFGADPIADAFKPSDGKPMWMEAMCGAGAITALINHGLDLKRRDRPTGETLLHYVASRSRFFTEEDSLAVVQLLVDKGSDLLARDDRGYTPLLRAADDQNDDGRLNLSVLEFFLERDEYSRIEKIEAMELIGATIFFKAKNAPHFPKAFYYWNRALHLRHQVEKLKAAESGSPSSKKMLGRKIGRHVEWTTLAELDQLKKQQENHPSEALEVMDYLDTFHEVDTQMQHPDEFAIQALLVKLRILSGLDGERHFYLSNQYIDYISDSTTLGDDEKFTRILDIRWGMLDVVIYRLVPLPTNRFFWVQIAVDIEKLVSILSTLQDHHPRLLTFEKLKTSLDLILLATDRSPIAIINVEHVVKNDDMSYYRSRISENLFHLLKMIFHLPTILNERDTTSLIQSLRLLGPFRLGNLLLPACKKLGKFKALALVRVLLEAGADPNVAVDKLHGNASLHYAAMMIDRKLGDAACLLLIEFGAKLYQVNKAGKTALDEWIQLNETEDNWNEEVSGWSARPDWCCPLPTLLRLAARVIRIHKLPYADGETPANLHSLIELKSLK